MILYESWDTSIREPDGRLAKRGEVEGRIVERVVGDEERVNRRPEGEEEVGRLKASLVDFQYTIQRSITYSGE